MPDTTSKTDNFLKAIEKYAEEQRTKMKSEAEVFKAKEMNRAEEEGLKEAYTMIQKKMSEINNQISSELSRAETASKKRIFLKRREIEDEVFAKAEKKLIEYTATDKYVSKLEKSAENISKVLDADDVILYVKEKDMAHKQKLIKAFGRKCEVAVSDDIKLGGITDETLDSRLAEQHEWCCENSGLKVTE